jgi:Putative addiction module component
MSRRGLDIASLTLEERLSLLEELWDSLAAATVLFSVGAGRSEAGHGHIAGCWRVVRHRYL